jgi:hypothetical protein
MSDGLVHGGEPWEVLSDPPSSLEPTHDEISYVGIEASAGRGFGQLVAG